MHFLGSSAIVPSLTKTKPQTLREQFGNPTGWLGRWVGYLMAIKNRTRNQWVINLLNIKPTDRILEIGFGPGVQLQRAAQLAHQGYIAGIDHSQEMIRQASQRNKQAKIEGRVDIQYGSAEELPFAENTFDIIFSINSVQFWSDRKRALYEQQRTLRPGGLIAIAIQPQSKGATSDTTRKWGEQLHTDLATAGFVNVRTETKKLTLGAPAVCVLGFKELC